MTIMTVSETRANLPRLLDEVAESHKPAIITGKRSNCILIAEEDWNSIQETLHLLSIPGMRESIRTGLETPVENCSEKPGW
jgi:antitoxin YefM